MSVFTLFRSATTKYSVRCAYLGGGLPPPADGHGPEGIRATGRGAKTERVRHPERVTVERSDGIEDDGRTGGPA